MFVISEKRNRRQCISIALSVFAGLLVGLVVFSAISPSSEQAAIDKNKSVGAFHMLMMGLNPNDMGGFSAADVRDSTSIEDPSDRKRFQLETIIIRLENLGPTGVIKLCIKKTLSNFDDGSFGWTKEGNFFRQVNGIGGNIADLYGLPSKNDACDVDSNNTYYKKPFFIYSQIIWFLVLLGLCFGRLNACKDKPSNFAISAMYLSVFILAVFLMVFECRARYLFLYTPVFCMLGLYGWRAVYQKVKAGLLL